MSSYPLDCVTPCHDPVPNSQGIEGHGEGLEYAGETFWYRVGKHIPKDKPVSVSAEHTWLGRCNGIKEWLILAWNGESFTVLEHVDSGLREEMKKYKGLSCEEAIEKAKELKRERNAWKETAPVCRVCNSYMIVFEDDQPDDLCLKCWKNTLD